MLGIVEAVSDLIRRCEIMFPEGDTTMFGLVADADDGLVFADEVSGSSLRRSSGLGGVTAVLH